jgi:HD-like signal output (HDOD) protein
VSLPPYPSVALEVQRLVQQADFGIADLLAYVSSDAALAATVLKVANSAVYGRGQIASLQQALSRLGASEVVRLALACGLAAVGRRSGVLGSLRRQAWQDSLASAVICQLLAERRKLDQDVAFASGLLHDFGWLIGISAIEDLIAERPEEPARSEADWSAMVQRWHVRLGIALAARWQLPDLLRQVIWLHHTQDSSKSAHAALVDLVAASDSVLRLLSQKPGLTAADLSGVLYLRGDEPEGLAEALPGLPAILHAFGGEPAEAQPPSKVAPPQTTLSDRQRPLTLAVSQVSPRRRGPYRMLGIAAGGWSMIGREPIPENQLIGLEVGDAPEPLRLWARTTLCAKEGEGWKLECKPFALDGVALGRWNELVRGAGAAKTSRP